MRGGGISSPSTPTGDLLEGPGVGMPELRGFTNWRADPGLEKARGPRRHPGRGTVQLNPGGKCGEW